MTKILKSALSLSVSIFLSWAFAAILAPIGLGFAGVLIPPIVIVIMEWRIHQSIPLQTYIKGVIINTISILITIFLFLLYFYLRNINSFKNSIPPMSQVIELMIYHYFYQVFVWVIIMTFSKKK